MTDRRSKTILAALTLLFACGYTASLFLLAKRPGRVIAGDAVHYFVYLRSLVMDGDLHFANDYLGLYTGRPEVPGVGWTYRPTATGHVPSFWAVGAPLLWAPFFLAATALVAAARALGSGLPADGFGLVFQMSVVYAGVAAAGAAAWVAYLLARLWSGPGIAFLATLAIWLGSSALYYSLVSPAYSHSASMLVVSLFLYAWASTRGDRTYGRFFRIGCLGGLCALVRFQDAVFLVVPALEAADDLFRSVRESGAGWRSARRFAGRLAACGAGAFLAFAPQSAAWMVLFGRAFTIPQGPEFMRWGSPRVLEVLFSDRQGLFTWTPVLLFAVAGLVRLARDRREIAIPMIAALALSVYVNAVVSDWWAGGAFGARRFTSCFPIFVVGLAALFERTTARTSAILTALFVGANLLLLFQYQLFMHGFEEIAPYPSGFYGLVLARFVVPFSLLARLWS